MLIFIIALALAAIEEPNNLGQLIQTILDVPADTLDQQKIDAFIQLCQTFQRCGHLRPPETVPSSGVPDTILNILFQELVDLTGCSEEDVLTKVSNYYGEGIGTSQTVTPFQATSDTGFDYARLVTEFGLNEIDEELIARIEHLTEQPVHPFIRRHLYAYHQGLTKILDAYEAGNPFYIYTGRGPSSPDLHLGHMIQFLFTKYLQDAFGAQVVIEIADTEEKYMKGLSDQEIEENAQENIRQIIAIGFDPEKTFIFKVSDYCANYPSMDQMTFDIFEKVNVNTLKKVFGFTDSDNFGKFVTPIHQMAPAFSGTFPHLFDGKVPCLIPCGVDQVPYFRLCNEVAQKLGYPKPATVSSQFIFGLGGPGSKMSASDPKSAIFMTDSKKKIRKKVGGAFSGGQKTRELQEELGADLEVDVAYQYLTFFLDKDDLLDEIAEKYGSGQMLTGEIKKVLWEVLTDLLMECQDRLAQLDDDTVRSFMTV